jgi:N utilization substance protein B
VTAATERPSDERPRHEGRHRAREAAVQMLYQWEVGRTPIQDVARVFWASAPRTDVLEAAPDAAVDRPAVPEAVRPFAEELACGVARTVEAIDPLIAEAAEHWRIERMAVIDRLILRLAVYEFLHQPETPSRVIINEALELARTFSADDAVRFINGILDGIRRSIQRE